LEQFRPRRGARASAIEQVDLSRLLVQAAVVATGRTRADLSAVRDGLAAGQDTFTATITTAGGDAATVIAAAATAVTGELQTKVAAGELTAAEVAAFNVQDRLTQLADEPGAPFLYDPAELAASVGAVGRSVNRDRRRVAIGLRARTAPRARRVVWYAVDGAPAARKANGPWWISGTHDYIAECRRQAWAQIAVWVGKAAVHLWRVSPFHDVGTRSASVGSGLSSMLMHPASPATKKKYYDVRVANKRPDGNSRYSIYGGWERGGGSRAC
jgi:hypothetical protein